MKEGIAVSSFLASVGNSPTLRVKALVDELREKGTEVYDFGIGEMNPAVPVPIALRKAIAKRMLDVASCGYSAALGAPELRNALCEDLHTNFGYNYDMKEICVCPGPKDAIFKTCLALLDPIAVRNRVLIFGPTYESFANVPVLLTGKQPLVIETQPPTFYPDPQILSKMLEDHAQEIAIIIINSPNNPTGTVYPDALLKKFAEILEKHPHIAVISDEVYHTIHYPDLTAEGFGNVLFQCPTIAKYMPRRTFVIGGLSKELAGTGLRLGWVCCRDQRLIAAIEIFQGNGTSCVNLPLQLGYADFLRSGEIKTKCARIAIATSLAAKKDLFFLIMAKRPALKKWFYPEALPTGAFYLFADARKLLQSEKAVALGLKTDEDLALYFLKTASVAVVPGVAFSRPGYFRLAYARNEAIITKGLDALNSALEQF
eukprot:TRINITY_DN4005_c0_g1_i3.p1 TRINITY_DN4005_c0_g1~~TRINITY_DN4005_c0_g1_i3.p1  ORF type:complete len:429 (+),score=44.77 TRINITY_DN4005_c0_g1_i3:73-1359(+)